MITAQIASIPNRVTSLERTVGTLIDQVDMLFVALNNYKEAPSYLTNNRKIVYALMDNSLGDAAKFYDVDQRKGYVLTCDDDLRYPPDYASYMIEGIKEYGGIVTLLGKRYDKRPISSYRGGYTALFRALVSRPTPAKVHLGGTGCMAFHTDDFKITTDDFLKPNMADLWVAKAAHEQGVTITVLPHRARYLVHTHHHRTIWHTTKYLDPYQTKIINSFLK